MNPFEILGCIIVSFGLFIEMSIYWKLEANANGELRKYKTAIESFRIK